MRSHVLWHKGKMLTIWPLRVKKKKNVEEFRAMVAKSNAFRIATIEKENTVLDLTKAITKLEEDLKKLQ